jgi:hypothetical protein
LAGGPFEFAGDEPEFATVAIADTGGIAGPIQGAEDGAIGGGCTGLEPDGEGRAAFSVDAGFLGEDAGFGLLGGLQGLGQKLGVFGGESFAQSGRRERIRLECGDLAVERGDVILRLDAAAIGDPRGLAAVRAGGRGPVAAGLRLRGAKARRGLYR